MNTMKFLARWLLALLLCALPLAGDAQTITQSGRLIPYSLFFSGTTTITLPSNWTAIDVETMGGGGGSGCGYVVTSGANISGGGTGGPGSYKKFTILASQVANATSLTITVAARAAPAYRPAPPTGPPAARRPAAATPR